MAPSGFELGAGRGVSATLRFIWRNLQTIKKFTAVPLLYILIIYFLQRFLPMGEKGLLVFALLQSVGLAFLGAYVGVGWGQFIFTQKTPAARIVPPSFTMVHRRFFVTLVGLHFLTSVAVSLILILVQSVMKAVLVNMLSLLFALGFIQLIVSLFLSARLKISLFQAIEAPQVNFRDVWQLTKSFWKPLMGSLFFIWVCLVLIFVAVFMLILKGQGGVLNPQDLLGSILNAQSKSPLFYLMILIFEMLLFFLQFTCIGLFYQYFQKNNRRASRL